MICNEKIDAEIAKLERRLVCLTLKLNQLRERHVGKEIAFTYWGGWDMGNLVARVTEIEETIDLLNDFRND